MCYSFWLGIFERKVQTLSSQRLFCSARRALPGPHFRQVYTGMGNFPAIFSAMYCGGNDVTLEDKVLSSRCKQQYCRARRALQNCCWQLFDRTLSDVTYCQPDIMSPWWRPLGSVWQSRDQVHSTQLGRKPKKGNFQAEKVYSIGEKVLWTILQEWGGVRHAL